jgi:hypothetical protein
MVDPDHREADFRPPDAASIGAMGAELARIVTSPGYFSMVADFRRQDPETRLATVWDVATLENVRSRDVAVTDTFRVAPRTFADPSATEPLVAFHDGRGSVAHNGVIVMVTVRDATQDAALHDSHRTSAGI